MLGVVVGVLSFMVDEVVLQGLLLQLWRLRVAKRLRFDLHAACLQEPSAGTSAVKRR